MYIYQNGKLYVQDGDKLVGVEIHSDKVLKIKTETSKFLESFEVLTPLEVRCRFNITSDSPYLFPREVVEDEPVKPVRGTARKSTRK